MPTPVPSSGPTRYRWKRYADGQTWAFARGVDYVVGTQSFIQAARLWGRANGYQVTARTTDTGCEIAFQPLDTP